MKKLKIFAVDDENNVLQLITSTLHKYDITTETSSMKALEMIHSHEEFDIFIVDYQMPNINGIELLEEINDVYNDRNFVSVLCTAYGTIYLFKDELIRGVFTFFLEKPFSKDALKEIVNKAIKRLGMIQNRPV